MTKDFVLRRESKAAATPFSRSRRRDSGGLSLPVVRRLIERYVRASGDTSIKQCAFIIQAKRLLRT